MRNYWIVLRTFPENNSCFCCFSYLCRCRLLKQPIHGHFSICEADQEKMSDWKTHSYTKLLYVPEVIWAQISKVSHMFLEVITTEASHGVLEGAWRSSTSVNVICISNCKHVIPRSKITYAGICKAYFQKLTCAPSLRWEASPMARIAIEWMGRRVYAVGELTTLFQLPSHWIIQGEHKDLGSQPP